MVKIETCRTIAMEYDECVELPHFEKSSFRVNKKIFLTLDDKHKRAVVKLTPVDQSVFCAFDKTAVYPSSGAWGKQGWTVVELKTVNKEFMKDIIRASYCNVAPASLSKKYQ